MELVTSRLFQAKDYSKAVAHKEETGGIIKRWHHSTLGVVYEVIYVPSVTEAEIERMREYTANYSFAPK